jgi:hypothetical protein
LGRQKRPQHRSLLKSHRRFPGMIWFVSDTAMPGPCREPNHALICYRRKDTKFAAALSERLRASYGIDCLRDEEGHKFGAEWRPCWRQQLDLFDARTPDAGPSVMQQLQPPPTPLAKFPTGPLERDTPISVPKSVRQSDTGPASPHGQTTTRGGAVIHGGSG